MCGIAEKLIIIRSRSVKNTSGECANTIALAALMMRGILLTALIALGMRRLASSTSPEAIQPISSGMAKSGYYQRRNLQFLSLRKNLESQGHRFSTQYDVEAVIHLYEEYGMEFVSELNGCFAFALWDIPRKKLILVVIGGEKPLHYALTKKAWFFASEIRPILEDPMIERRLTWCRPPAVLEAVYPVRATIFEVSPAAARTSPGVPGSAGGVEALLGCGFL